ncbi:hypothetical protein CASFOL_035917 [Castilleja foliolosa]|uniref:Exostosin GT47 domain-containing protein n=1 Tax=Castilleja foliolosa TaxID=1961234 RepID=A0ABD3BU68_9LAMI
MEEDYFPNLRFPRIKPLFAGLIFVSLAFILTTFLYASDPKFGWAVDVAPEAVYHSQKVMQMDYAEMEEKFRIYVYPHDDDIDINITKNTTISGKYASEDYFFRNIKESAFITRDPLQAHLFFIPISSHKLHQKAKLMAASLHRVEAEYGGWGEASWAAMLCVVVFLIFLPLGMAPGPVQPPSLPVLAIIPVFLAVVFLLMTIGTKTLISSYNKMASIVGKYVERLIAMYPHWNRTLGADHFFLTCHEIDVEATKKVSFLVKNAIRVVCSPSYVTRFIPHKDVSLPLVMQPFPMPTIRNDIAERNILGYWAGNSNSETRRKLVNLWGRDDELDIQRSKGVRMNKFYRSKFCICPVGSIATTNRITMAIHYGCVPVIMADYYDLPFNDILDWRKFSVILKESDVYNLKDILKAKAGADYRNLYNNLLKVQKHFQWNTPPVKYDTFGMLMYNLWLRRNVVKY